MSEPPLMPYLEPPVQEFYRRLHEFVQEDVRRRLTYLCSHYTPDSETTFAWDEYKPGIGIYFDGAWVIVYEVVDEGLVLLISDIALVNLR